jgi:hypothetical protein
MWSEHNSRILFNFFMKSEDLFGLKDNEVLTTTGDILEFKIIEGEVALSVTYKPTLTRKSQEKINRELRTPRLVLDDVTVTATPSAYGVELSFSGRPFTIDWTPERGIGLKGRQLTEREAILSDFARCAWEKSEFNHLKFPADLIRVGGGKAEFSVEIGPDNAHLDFAPGRQLKAELLVSRA